MLEHDDRMLRMRRAAANFALNPMPTFHVDMVPASRLPNGFRRDVPVLRVVFGERTFFDTSEDVLRPECLPLIRAVAEAFRGDAPDAAVFIAGHTDNRGSEAFNHDLSVRRAETVSRALLSIGVGEVALWRVGFGEAVPLVPNDTVDHMASNRRVEFLLSARVEPVFDVLRRQPDSVCFADSVESTNRCRAAIQFRREYVAVQDTSRRTRVPLERRPRHVAPGRAPAPVSIAERRQGIDLVERRLVIASPRF